MPPLQKISETNDTSFESPTIEFFESGKKLGVASSWEWPRPSNWKSNTFTKTHLEPLMIELLSILKLLSSTTIQGFLLRYSTLSYVIWPKNSRLSKFDETIGISLVKHFCSVSLFQVGLHIHSVPKNKDKFTRNDLFHCWETLIFTYPLVYEFLCGPKHMATPVFMKLMHKIFSNSWWHVLW